MNIYNFTKVSTTEWQIEEEPGGLRIWTDRRRIQLTNNEEIISKLNLLQ